MGSPNPQIARCPTLGESRGLGFVGSVFIALLLQLDISTHGIYQLVSRVAYQQRVSSNDPVPQRTACHGLLMDGVVASYYRVCIYSVALATPAHPWSLLMLFRSHQAHYTGRSFLYSILYLFMVFYFIPTQPVIPYLPPLFDTFHTTYGTMSVHDSVTKRIPMTGRMKWFRHSGYRVGST
jgi:hypothetical protein